ncbi:MAG TPA: hypothetical protein VGR70_12855 [Stellaceae bacterium]|nr:hypothetical protein [Stellaceae bacterium]
MKRDLSGAARAVAGGVAVLVLSAAPSLAQRDLVPCSAFSRNADGGWTVLAPVMLDLGGRIYSPTVGTTFGAGSMHNGVELSDVLDRDCL